MRVSVYDLGRQHAAIAEANANATERLLERVAKVLELGDGQLKAVNRILELLEALRERVESVDAAPPQQGAAAVPTDYFVHQYTAHQGATIIGDGTNAKAFGKMASDILVHTEVKMFDPATGLFSMAAVAAVRAEREKHKRIAPTNFKKNKRN